MQGASPTMRRPSRRFSSVVGLVAGLVVSAYATSLPAQISVGGGAVSIGGAGGLGVGIGVGGIGAGIGGPGGLGVGIGAGGAGFGIGGGSFNVGPGGIGAGGGFGGLGTGLGGLGYGVGNVGPGGLNVSSRGLGFGGAQLLSRNADGSLTIRAGAITGEKADLHLNLNRALGIIGSPTHPNLQPGDVIHAIDGVVVNTKRDVDQILANHSPNDDVVLSVLRNGTAHDVLVRLGTVLKTPPLSGRPESLVDPAVDISRSPLGALLGVTLGRGLEVTGVDPTGAAAAAGLKAGDILLSLNGLAVTSDHALAKALAALQTGNLTVLRDGNLVDVPLGSLRQADNVIAGAAATGGTGLDNALVGNADAGTGAGLGTVIGKFPNTQDRAAALGTGGGLGAVDNHSPVGNVGAGTGAGVGALLGGLSYRSAKDASAVGAGGGLGALGSNTPVGAAGAGGAVGAGLLQSSLHSLGKSDQFTALGTGGGLGAALNNNQLGNLDGGAGAGLGALLGNLPTASKPGGFLALGTGGGGGVLYNQTPIGDLGLGGGAGAGALLGGIGTPGGNAGRLTGVGAGGGLGTVLNNTPAGDANAGTGLGLGALLAGKNFEGTPLNPAVGLGNGTGVGLSNSPLGNINAKLGVGVGTLVGGVTQGKFPNGTVADAGGGVQLTASNTPVGDANISSTPAAKLAIGSGDNPGNVSAGGGGQGFGDGTNGSNPSRDGATTLGGGGSYGGGGVVVPGGSGNTGNNGNTTVGGGGGNSVDQGRGGITIPGGGGTGTGGGSGNGGSTGGPPSAGGNNTLIGGTGGTPDNNGAGGIVIPGPSSGGNNGGGNGTGNNGNTVIGATGGNDTGNGAGGIVLPGGGNGNNGGGNTFIGGTGGNDSGSGTGGILIPGTGVANAPPTVIGGGGTNNGGGGVGGIFIPGGTTAGVPGTPGTPGSNNNGTGGSFGSGGGAFTNAGYGGYGGYGYGYPWFYSPFLGLYGDRGAAFLGVMFENDQLLIAHVCPHGPANAAGVLKGDRILAIDQQRFENHPAFITFMATMTPLELVQLTVMRENEPISLAVELGGLLPPEAVYGTDVDGILTESIADYDAADLKAQESLGFLAADAAHVIHVCPTDAAFGAGLRRGDELRTINETPFADRSALTKFVGTLKAGEPLNVVVRRNGQEKLLTWGFEEPHPGEATLQKIVEAAPPAVIGKDLHVARADPGGPAYKAGLRNGDVITYVNGRKLTAVDDAAAVLRQASQSEPIHVVANRNGRAQSIVWQPTDGTNGNATASGAERNVNRR